MVGGRIDHVIFVGTTPYPNGQAATNRLISLINQLPLNGINTTVYCLASTRYPTNNSKNNEYKRKGVFELVDYEYLSLFVKNPKRKILRLISGLIGFLSLPFKLLKYRKLENVVLVTNMIQIHYVLYFSIIKKVFGFKYVLIRSEYPNHKNKNKKVQDKIYTLFFKKWFLKSFNGFVFMTERLANYFADSINKKSNYIIIPTTVDTKRFSGNIPSPFPHEYIGYAGSLSNVKDGINILLKAFIKIAEQIPRINLVIVGKVINDDQYEENIKIINSCNTEIKNRIIYTGLVDRNDIPTYLMNAKILVLPRPNSTQAEGGFPSKLGEYLATGKPIISTTVGEIPLYLKDRTNVVFAQPNDENSLYREILWTLNNYDEATKIGENGREVCMSVFNSQVQGKILANYLQSFIN
jgi:glycosyltransferase involved in cell wall biosynthesis